MANGRLTNSLHDLLTDEKKAEEFSSDFSSQEMVDIAIKALHEYNLPWRRYVVSHDKEIREKLKLIGYEESSTAANPMNLKSAKEIFAVLREGGGENDNSFKTIFMRLMTQAFTAKILAKRLAEKEAIVKQKSELLLLEEKRLKEEEALVLLQLDKLNCIKALSVLKSQTSELGSKKIELENNLQELKESINQSNKEEAEKRIKLEETSRALEEELAKFHEAVAKHREAHPDFASENFTLEQLKQCKESALQGWWQTAAIINGKLKLQDELKNIKPKKVIMLDESQCDVKFEEMRAARSEDLSNLIKARGMTPERLKEIKEHLTLKLHAIREKQGIIKDLSLEATGFHATTNSDISASAIIQDDYEKNEATTSSGEVQIKPVAKSIKEMKIKQGMSGKNKEVYEKLNFFFANKPGGRAVTEEVEDRPLPPIPISSSI